MNTNIDKMKDAMVDKVASMNDQQVEEILAAVNVIMSGGSDEEARAAIVKTREKYHHVTPLERLRIMSLMTKEKLSEISGVSLDVINGIEDCTLKTIKKTDLLQLSEALGVDGPDLFELQ